LVGIDSPQRALELLARLRTAAGDQVTTFELMPRAAVEITVRHIAGVANPLSQESAWYLLVEFTSPNPRQNLAALLTDELQRAAQDAVVVDAMLATSIAQSQAMWKLRESVPEAQRHHGASLKHDVSVPVSRIPDLIAAGSALVAELVPTGDVMGYGHLGDGNLHFNVSQRPGTDAAQFLARGAALEHAIFDLVGRLGGSISAEHGIGRLKAAEFAERADPVELALMRDVKRALDPTGIMNPGKVLA
jgi:D-lactate dehydrogenase (cytochrome)